ncbi:DUF448 domain-containing protein [Desulfosediminicola flagellatus]
MRFVWHNDAPMPDKSGYKSGRGAYCCKSEKCMQKFLKQNKKWKRVFRL